MVGNKSLFMLFLIFFVLTIAVGALYLVLFIGDMPNDITSIDPKNKVSKDTVSLDAKDVKIQINTKNLEDLTKLTESIPDNIVYKNIFIKCPHCDLNPQDVSECNALLESRKNDPELLSGIQAIGLDLNQIDKIIKEQIDGNLACVYYQYI